MDRKPLPVMSVLGPLDASGDQVRLTLHSRGMRVTPTRVAVLAALTDDSADVHHTAPELYQNLPLPASRSTW